MNSFFSFMSLSVFQLDHLWLIAGTDSRMNSRSSVTDQPFFSSSTHPLRQGTNIWHAIKLGALLLLAQFEEAEIIRNWLHFRPPTRLLDPLFSWTEHQTDFKWELLCICVTAWKCTMHWWKLVFVQVKGRYSSFFYVYMKWFLFSSVAFPKFLFDLITFKVFQQRGARCFLVSALTETNQLCSWNTSFFCDFFCFQNNVKCCNCVYAPTKDCVVKV